MMGLRYEEYSANENNFTVFSGVKRNHTIHSEQMNWHEDLEIQFYNSGEGTVILDGKSCFLNKDSVVVVNSNVIHFTYSDTELTYTSLIISAAFCKKMNIDCDSLYFSPEIKDKHILSLLNQFSTLIDDDSITYKTAKINKLLLEILITLADNYSVNRNNNSFENKNLERVKSAIKYIRENYNKKITLDGISKSVYADKYALSREFKKYTGHTIINFLNIFRCQQATNLIKSGYSVSESSEICGFNNNSFFTKTFKHYMGSLPSKI